jgi:putative endonuclease
MSSERMPDAALTCAADYLNASGFRVLDRGWHCPEGSIDIVATDDRMLVVCEVKTRTGRQYATQLGVISRAKRGRLRKLAIRWLKTHGVIYDQVRIDVIGLVYEGTGGFTLQHVRGVG